MKTKNYIKELRENFVRILKEQEKGILKYWGTDIGNKFTEQDACERSRKVIDSYQKIKFKKVKKIATYYLTHTLIS